MEGVDVMRLELIRRTLEEFGVSVHGLVVSHRGVTVDLILGADFECWHAFAWTHTDEVVSIQVDGRGATPLEALDDCVNEVADIEAENTETNDEETNDV